jgi:tetratricopeptide (TPR) repeat protein
MGDGLLHQGKIHQAFVHYEKALELEPENPALQYRKGLAFVIGGMNEEAVRQFQFVLEKNPEFAPACEGLGRACFQMKDYEKAEKHFRKAVHYDFNLWQSHNYLGNIYDYQGKYEMAIEAYYAAIAVKPDDGVLYNNLGISYLLAGKHAAAVEAFKKALEAKNTRRKVYNNLGMALCEAGHFQEGLEAFRKGGSESAAYNNLGCVYMKQQEYEKAIECFEKAIEVNPTFYVKADKNLHKARSELAAVVSE